MEYRREYSPVSPYIFVFQYTLLERVPNFRLEATAEVELNTELSTERLAFVRLTWYPSCDREDCCLF